MMFRKVWVLIFLISGSVSLAAKVKLPALVGDNMVLQRDTEVLIWGWADPGESVMIEFEGQKWAASTNKKGEWYQALPKMPAGGPYDLTIKGENTITIRNILFGDVWLASGQSNMEWPLNNINNSKAEIASADFLEIRLFTVARKVGMQTMDDVNSAGWQLCTPASAERFSAVAYLFGRELYQKYEVPIGLIHSSWGGTVAEAWVSKQGLKPFPELMAETRALEKIPQSEYDALSSRIKNWYQDQGAIDRGQSTDGTSWADPQLEDSDWKTMSQPSLWYDHVELMRFGGTLWLRKSIDIPAEDTDQPIEVSLSNITQEDITFFNGHFIGKTAGYDPVSRYEVPRQLVGPGKNVIAIRITGTSEFGGIIGDPKGLFIQMGSKKISLVGDWLYKTGPDLSTMPRLEGMPKYSSTMPKSPMVLYNGMIAPLIYYKIKGVIWYQGESNAERMEQAMQYYELFPALIQDWRKQWGYDFPFLFVQLANWRRDQPEPADYPWAQLRNAQYETLQLPKTGMAITIDIGNVEDIHPRNKQDVAHRLALAAQKVAYQEDIVFSGPTFRSMKVEKGKIRLSFNHIGSGLSAKDKYGYIKGFTVAGKDQKFFWAKAYRDGNDVIVYADEVKEPVAVRYNWGNSPDGNLYNEEGLPAVPFKMDNW